MTTASRILGWSLLVGVIVATLAPIGLRPVTDAPAALERFGAYAAVSFLFAFGYPHRRWQILVILSVVAGAMEALQMVEATRHGRFEDVAVKIAGCWVGVTAAFALALAPGRMAKDEMPQ